MRLIFLVIVFLSIPITCLAWTKNLTFESGSINNGTDAWSYAGTTTYIDQTYTKSGSYSVRVLFNEGDNCWDATLTCGGIFGIAEADRVGEGEELWVRAYYFFPTGWTWLDQTAGGESYRKIMRFTVNGTSNGNIGIGAHQHEYDDTGEVEANSEITGYIYPASTALRYTGTYFPTNEWVCIEQYVKFSATPATAQHMVWRNGVKVWDLKENAGGSYPTMANAADKVYQVLFFTYWNQNVPATQNAYMDDIVLTTDTPAGRDADGNPMIGPIAAASTVYKRTRIGSKDIRIGGKSVEITQ